MTLLLAVTWDGALWERAFKSRDPDLRVFIHGRDAYDPAAIRYAAVWRPPAGLLARLPQLDVIFNLGAGVDALLTDPTLPNVPIVRLVDPDLTQRMLEWVALQVLIHHRGQLSFLERQRQHDWHQEGRPLADEVQIGLMGYGALGAAVARTLRGLGYRVRAWTRTPRSADGIAMFSGQGGLEPFLAATDILVALLPLTPDTHGLLDRSLFARLRRDGPLGAPVLINAGRGGLQVEADIVTALRDGTLGGASLDVFETEPLPPDSPLWDAPRCVITPHVSAESDPGAVSAYVLDQIRRFEAGRTLENVVDRDRGY